MFVALILFLYGNGNYLPSGVTEGGFLTNDLEHSDKDLSPSSSFMNFCNF